MPSRRSDKQRSNSTTSMFPKDWQEFLSLLILHGVKFVIVGGHAFALHARPRMTEDLDVFVEASPPNAEKLRRALADFGFGNAAPEPAVLAERGRVFMLGAKPFRIDILTKISGVSFEKAWRDRVLASTSQGTLPFISRADFVRNKTAAGRPKDLRDLDELSARTRR
jgi:hypothetical protein